MGALKSWAVSGELLGTSSTKKIGVKVKWREVGNLHFAERGVGQDPRITCSLLVARVGPTPQGVLALDFGTRQAHVWARPDPRYGPWRKSRSISMPDDAMQPRRPDVRRRPIDAC